MIQSNIQETITKFKNIEKKVNNMKPIMHSIGEKIVTKSLESFEKESDPITGKKWKPIYASSLFAQAGGKRKSKIKSGKRHTKSFLTKASNKRILQDQGMRGGLMGSIDYTASKDSVTIHAGKEYAATHFFGDQKRNIQQRRYLPFDDDLDIDRKLENEILEDIEDFILG